MSDPRLIPRNIEAEQAVIGGVLNGAELPPLLAEDCYRPEHRFILQAMHNLKAKGEPIDYLTVKAELERAGKILKVGGISYIVSLAEHVPFIAHVARYAEAVKAKATLRKIISECGRVAEMAFEPGATVQEVLDDFHTIALRIDDGGSAETSVKELAKKELKQIEDAYQSKEHLLGIPTGFKRLDRMTLGWQPPDLIVIAARPSQGKTALALDTAKAAAYARTKVYFASLEMSSEQLMRRLLSGECGISGRSLRLGRFPEGDWPRITKASGRLAELDIIIDDTPAISEMELARRVRRVKPGLLVVDYLQLMRSAQKADRKDLEIANITAALKALVKEINIPVLLLSQLNREVEKRTIPKPRLSDLRDSGAIEQDADLVLGLYRPEGSKVVELICLKHRNGPLGTVRLEFREELASFRDLPQD